MQIGYAHPVSNGIMTLGKFTDMTKWKVGMQLRVD